MYLLENQEVPFYVFENLQAISEIRHFVSTRQGGVSEAPFDTLNVSLRFDDPSRVLQNRKILAEAVKMPAENFCWAQQVHGHRVALVGEKDRGRGRLTWDDAIPNADAMITQTPYICLAVTSADCVPLLFYDPVQKAIGAAHSGWRGTVQKIATHTVQALQKYFGSHPRDLLVGIGPCISGAIYEVGSEVETAVREAFGTEAGYLIPNTNTGKKHFDLVYANQQQLYALGIPEKNIEVSGFCTYQQADIFFSYRKQGGRTGIFASGIVLV